MSLTVPRTCSVVAQIFRGLKAYGCKSLYIETIFWLSIMTVWILHTMVEHPITDSISWRWASTECQQCWVWPFQQSQCWIVASIKRGSIGCLYGSKGMWQDPCPSKKWTSMECQWFLVLHPGQLLGYAMAVIHNHSIGYPSGQNCKWWYHYYLQKMIPNGPPTIFRYGSGIINALCKGVSS